MIRHLRIGRRRALVIGLPVLILAAAASIAGYLAATRPEVRPDPARERVWPVAAVAVERADVAPELRFYGEIVAGRKVELRPLVAGRVIEVGEKFLDGAVVARGDLLVAIDPFRFEAAVREIEARIAETEARIGEYRADIAAERELIAKDEKQLALDRRELARREKLLKRGSGTVKARDDARTAVIAREQQLIARRQAVGRLEARVRQQTAVLDRLRIELSRARRDLEETRLTAPFDGFLLHTATDVGRRVGVGDLVATVIDAGRLEARFHVPDREFARLLDSGGFRDRPARVVWQIGRKRFVYRARIEREESEIAPASGGVRLFARILDADARTPLRPGAFVEVYVRDRVYRDVVRLSETALHDGNRVYKVVDGRLVPVAVEVVARDGKDVLLRGELSTDDRVVVTRFAEIGPDVRVTVQ